MTASLPRMIIQLRSPAVVQHVISLFVAVVQVQRQQLCRNLTSWICIVIGMGVLPSAAARSVMGMPWQHGSGPLIFMRPFRWVSTNIVNRWADLLPL